MSTNAENYIAELSGEQLGAVDTPADIVVSASAHEEIAVNILAGIIADKEQIPTPKPIAFETSTVAIAVDPVCGMDVEIAITHHQADWDGETYYFCCAGCRSRFLKDPSAIYRRSDVAVSISPSTEARALSNLLRSARDDGLRCIHLHIILSGVGQRVPIDEIEGSRSVRRIAISGADPPS